MKRTSTRTDPLPGRQTKKTVGYVPSKIPQCVQAEKKKTKGVPDFGKLHQKWQRQLEIGKICQKKPQTVPTEFNLSKSSRPDVSKNARKELFSDEHFEADHKSLDDILRGLPGREIASRRATTATGRDMKRIQSCHSIGSRRVFGELPCDPDQKSNRRRSRSANADVPLKALKESAEVKFEPDPQALRSIINSEGMTPVRVAAPKRQTTTGAVIRQERPSIYDAMTSSRHRNSKFAAVCMTKMKNSNKRPAGSPAQRASQPKRDPSREGPKKPAEDQSNSLAEEFEVDPQSLRSIINSESLTPVRVTAPVRSTLGGPVMRRERPSIYDAMTSSRNNSVFGNVRLSEYKPGIRSGKLTTGSNSSPASTGFPLKRTPAKGPVPDLIRSATKSEARRVPRNGCSILADGTFKKAGEQKHVKWADVFKESSPEEKNNVQRTLFTTPEGTEEDEEDECKENIRPLATQPPPVNLDRVTQSSCSGQAKPLTPSNGQQTTETNLVQALTSDITDHKDNSVTHTDSGDLRTQNSGGNIYGLASYLSYDRKVGGEAQGSASRTDETVYKRGLFPTTADKANCHDDSPRVSEDVLPISGDRSCNRGEEVTHTSPEQLQAHSRQAAGDTERYSNSTTATCLQRKGPEPENQEPAFSRQLQHRSFQGLPNSGDSHARSLQNLPGNVDESSYIRYPSIVGKLEHLQLGNVQVISNDSLERKSKETYIEDGHFRDNSPLLGQAVKLCPSAATDDFNGLVIKENQPISSRFTYPIKDGTKHGKNYVFVQNQAQHEGHNFASETGKLSHCTNDLVTKHPYHASDVILRQEQVTRPFPANASNLGDLHQRESCDRRKFLISKEILVESTKSQSAMAMFTETDQDENSQAPASSAREQTSSCERTRDSVGNFVGRVQKNKKRQSIAELNESISESNLHMQTLCQQAQSLRNQSKARLNTNIMYQLELIRKQQEELSKLQRELQGQLQTETEGLGVEDQTDNQWGKDRDSRGVEGQTDNQWGKDRSSLGVEGQTDNQWGKDRGNAVDVRISNLISSSEQMLTLHSDERSQNLQSIEEERNNNNDVPFLNSPVNPKCAASDCVSVTKPFLLSDSTSLLSTPRTPHISHKTKSLLCTPSSQLHVYDVQNNFPFVRSPVPLKPAQASPREGAQSPSPPPIWTAMALKSEAERHSAADVPPTPAAKRRLEQEPDYAKTAEEPMDLSVKSVTESTDFNSSVQRFPVNVNTVTTRSAFRLSTSSVGLSRSIDIGSLSLKANTRSPPSVISQTAPSPHPCSRRTQPTQEIPLYKEVLSIANEQRYREAMLDDECARYCCRLQTAQPLGFWFERGHVNPVATVLSSGDEMHFVPIHEEKFTTVSVGEGSAFHSYSP